MSLSASTTAGVGSAELCAELMVTSRRTLHPLHALRRTNGSVHAYDDDHGDGLQHGGSIMVLRTDNAYNRAYNRRYNTQGDAPSRANSTRFFSLTLRAQNGERCAYWKYLDEMTTIFVAWGPFICFFFSIPFIILALLTLLALSPGRNSIPGSHGGPSSPLPTPVRAYIFLIARRIQHCFLPSPTRVWGPCTATKQSINAFISWCEHAAHRSSASCARACLAGSTWHRGLTARSSSPELVSSPGLLRVEDAAIVSFIRQYVFLLKPQNPFMIELSLSPSFWGTNYLEVVWEKGFGTSSVWRRASRTILSGGCYLGFSIRAAILW